MLPAVLAFASGTLLLAGNSDKADEAPGPEPSADLEIPLPALTRKQWLGFLKAAICGKPNTIGPNYRLGTFGLSVRRLCDLGVMEDPQVLVFGNQQVWDAKWINPKNLQDFQRRPMVQYDLFARSVKDYAENEQLRANVDRNIDGQVITLSGVLMLAQRAGLAGMERWIGSPKVRERFKVNTTAFVKRANGIF